MKPSKTRTCLATQETQKLKKNQKGEEEGTKGPQVQADQKLSLNDHEEVTLGGTTTRVYDADYVTQRGPHTSLGYPALAGGEGTILHSSDLQGKLSEARAGTTLG